MSSRSDNNWDSIQIIANQRGAIGLVRRQIIIEMTPDNFEDFVSDLQSSLPLVKAVKAMNEAPKLRLVTDLSRGCPSVHRALILR